MSIENVVDKLITAFNEGARNLPSDFYSTFRYTQTGKNWTHPITLGILAKFLIEQYPEMQLAIDCRFNSQTKFQPDLTIIDKSRNPIIFVDYESPNSSDARVLPKDIKPYLAIKSNLPTTVPYLIITTLPNQPAPDWELRWTNGYNILLAGQRNKIRENPYIFWHNHYSESISELDMDIHWLNISCNTLGRCELNAPLLGAASPIPS